MDIKTRTALKMLKDIVDQQQKEITELREEINNSKCCERLASLEQMCNKCCTSEKSCEDRLSALETMCNQCCSSGSSCEERLAALEKMCNQCCSSENNNQCCDETECCDNDKSQCCIDEKECCVENTCCPGDSVVNDILNN